MLFLNSSPLWKQYPFENHTVFAMGKKYFDPKNAKRPHRMVGLWLRADLPRPPHCVNPPSISMGRRRNNTHLLPFSPPISLQL